MRPRERPCSQDYLDGGKPPYVVVMDRLERLRCGLPVGHDGSCGQPMQEAEREIECEHYNLREHLRPGWGQPKAASGNT